MSTASRGGRWSTINWLRVLLTLCLIFVRGVGVVHARVPKGSSRGKGRQARKETKKRREPKSRFQNVKSPDLPGAGPHLLPKHSTPSDLRNSPLLANQQKSLVILGATGGLGSQIAKDAIRTGRHQVFGVVRSSKKAQKVFEMQELLQMRLFEGDISADNHTNNVKFLTEVFRAAQADIVIEVLSNSLRPSGIEDLMYAAAKTGVDTVVVCGGAGQLYSNVTIPKGEDNVRIGFAVDAPDWLVSVTELHMSVQEIAFPYSTNLVIPTVFQISPPGMSVGRRTGKYELVYDYFVDGAPMSATYSDVSSMFLDAVQKPHESNRKMVGLGPRIIKRRLDPDSTTCNPQSRTCN